MLRKCECALKTSFLHCKSDFFEVSISMYLVLIAWLYVTVMMTVAEATNSNGTVLGAMVTFVLYGALPLALVVYLMRTPARRKTIRARESARSLADGASLGAGLSGATSVDDRASLRCGLSREVSGDPDTSSHTAAAAQGDTVAPVREVK